MRTRTFLLKAIAFTLCLTFTTTNTIAYSDSASVTSAIQSIASSISHAKLPAASPKFARYLSELRNENNLKPASRNEISDQPIENNSVSEKEALSHNLKILVVLKVAAFFITANHFVQIWIFSKFADIQAVSYDGKFNIPILNQILAPDSISSSDQLSSAVGLHYVSQGAALFLFGILNITALGTLHLLTKISREYSEKSGEAGSLFLSFVIKSIFFSTAITWLGALLNVVDILKYGAVLDFIPVRGQISSPGDFLILAGSLGLLVSVSAFAVLFLNIMGNGQARGGSRQKQFSVKSLFAGLIKTGSGRSELRSEALPSELRSSGDEEHLTQLSNLEAQILTIRDEADKVSRGIDAMNHELNQLASVRNTKVKKMEADFKTAADETESAIYGEMMEFEKKHANSLERWFYRFYWRHEFAETAKLFLRLSMIPSGLGIVISPNRWEWAAVFVYALITPFAMDFLAHTFFARSGYLIWDAEKKIRMRYMPRIDAAHQAFKEESERISEDFDPKISKIESDLTDLENRGKTLITDMIRIAREAAGVMMHLSHEDLEGKSITERILKTIAPHAFDSWRWNPYLRGLLGRFEDPYLKLVFLLRYWEIEKHANLDPMIRKNLKVITFYLEEAVRTNGADFSMVIRRLYRNYRKIFLSKSTGHPITDQFFTGVAVDINPLHSNDPARWLRVIDTNEANLTSSRSELRAQGVSAEEALWKAFRELTKAGKPINRESLSKRANVAPDTVTALRRNDEEFRKAMDKAAPPRVLFDAGSAADWIIEQFKAEENQKRLTLPGPKELAENLGFALPTVDKHYDRKSSDSESRTVLTALEKKMKEKGFGPDLRSRLQIGIELRRNPERGYARIFIRLFQEDPDLDDADGILKDIAERAGVIENTVFKRIDTMLPSVRSIISEEEMERDLKKRVISALDAIRNLNRLRTVRQIRRPVQKSEQIEAAQAVKSPLKDAVARARERRMQEKAERQKTRGNQGESPEAKSELRHNPDIDAVMAYLTHPNKQTPPSRRNAAIERISVSELTPENLNAAARRIKSRLTEEEPIGFLEIHAPSPSDISKFASLAEEGRLESGFSELAASGAQPILVVHSRDIGSGEFKRANPHLQRLNIILFPSGEIIQERTNRARLKRTDGEDRDSAAIPGWIRDAQDFVDEIQGKPTQPDVVIYPEENHFEFNEVEKGSSLALEKRLRNREMALGGRLIVTEFGQSPKDGRYQVKLDFSAVENIGSIEWRESDEEEVWRPWMPDTQLGFGAQLRLGRGRSMFQILIGEFLIDEISETPAAVKIGVAGVPDWLLRQWGMDVGDGGLNLRSEIRSENYFNLDSSRAVGVKELSGLLNLVDLIKRKYESPSNFQTAVRTRAFKDFLNKDTEISRPSLSESRATRSAVMFLPKFNDQLGHAFRDIFNALDGRQEVVIYYDSPVMRRAILRLIDDMPGSELVQFVSSDNQAGELLKDLNVTRAHLVGFGDEMDSTFVQNLSWTLKHTYGIQEIVKNGVGSVGEFMSLLGAAMTRISAEWQGALLNAKAA